MGLKIFINANIIVNFIEQRPFNLVFVNKLFEFAENNQIDLCISESVVTNALYITGLDAQITKMLNLVSVICSDVDTLKIAMKSSFIDKEDGILYYGAFMSKADYFITRNKKIYINHKFNQLPVISPKELIHKIAFK